MICRVCKEVKPTTDFYKDKTKPLGFERLCKECSKIKAKKYKTSKVSRDQWLRYKYKINQQDYDTMAKQQDMKCAICKRSDIKLVVDHCHTVGHVRGLLCGECNCALGMFKDNTDTLNNAIEYLKAKGDATSK